MKVGQVRMKSIVLERTISDRNQFEEAAKCIMQHNTGNNSYTLAVFDIDKFSEINEMFGFSVGDELIQHICSTLQANITWPHLCCRLYDDNFALFLENYKSVDIALLVICLAEEIAKYNSDLKNKLSFGICQAKEADFDIEALYKRAIYAKSTIKGETHQLLASYTEVEQY